MSTNQFFRVFGLWLLGLVAQAQTFTWVQAGYGSKDGNLYDISLSKGNLIATGDFQKDLSFGALTLADPVGYAAAFTGSFSTIIGSPNWLLQNLNPQSSSTVVQGGATCTDTAGNLYVAYYLEDNAYFGQLLVATTTPTVAIVKYSGDGAVIWVKAFHTNYPAVLYPLIAYRLVSAGNNALYFTVTFKGQLVSGSTTYNSAAIPIMSALLKLDNAGNILWSSELPGATVTALGADYNGNLVAAGSFNAQITFTSTQSLNGANGHLFVAKYSPAGAFQWVQQMGGQANDQINGLTTDASGNVAFCGYFGNIGNGAGYATATFGPTTLTTVGNYGQPAGFVAKYSPQGSYQWVRGIYNVNDATTQAQRIVVNPGGDFYVSGFAAYGTRFGTFTAGGNGSYDGFVAKYGAAGTEQWLTTFGGPNNEIYAGNALAIDDHGYLYVGGSFVGTAEFSGLGVGGAPKVYTPYFAQLRDNRVLATQPATTSANTLQLYPNPSTGPVQLNWPAGLRPVNLTVLDMLGRTVREQAVDVAATRQTLSLMGLAPGVYLVRLQTAEHGQLTQRLVIP